MSQYDPITICKFGERKKLEIKKNSQKTIFYKQTQAKLSPTKMELCGGENAYRKGLLATFFVNLVWTGESFATLKWTVGYFSTACVRIVLT